MDHVGLLSRFALHAEPNPRDAAANCFAAGIVLLAFCQDIAPTPDPDAMMDEMFAALRTIFHSVTTPTKMDA